MSPTPSPPGVHRRDHPRSTCGIGHPTAHSGGSSHQRDRHTAFRLPGQGSRIVVFFLRSLLHGRQALWQRLQSTGHHAPRLDDVTEDSVHLEMSHALHGGFDCAQVQRRRFRIFAPDVLRGGWPRLAEGLPRVALRPRILLVPARGRVQEPRVSADPGEHNDRRMATSVQAIPALRSNRHEGWMAIPSDGARACEQLVARSDASLF